MGLRNGPQPNRMSLYSFAVTNTTDRQDGNTIVG